MRRKKAAPHTAEASSENPGIRSDTKKPVQSSRLRKFFVDNVEPLLVAVVLALIIRCFVIEPFRIPTGSMAPTLRGKHITVACVNCGFKLVIGRSSSGNVSGRCPNCGYEQEYYKRWIGTGDHIMVDKNVYALRDPERYSVIVFKYKPGRDPQKNYIKRLVGMGGERIAISHGDVYVDGKLAPKPERVQRAIWIPVYSMAHGGKATDPRYDWQAQPQGTWDFSPQALRLSGKGFARYGPVVSEYGYNVDSHNADARAEQMKVGDLRLSFKVRCEGERGELSAGIREDSLSHAVKMVFEGRDKQLRMSLVPSGGEAIPCRVGSAGGDSRRVEFWNYDGKLAVFLDGEKAGEADVTDAEFRTRGFPESAAELSYDGDFVIEDLRIDRDIYYTPAFDMEMPIEIDKNGHEGVTVPPGHIFVMGDNVPSSQDSRKEGMGFIPADRIVGQAFLSWWPPWRWGLTR